MPSLWPLLLQLDDDTPEYLLGLVLAAFGLATFAFAPLVGYALDTRPMRTVIVAQLWVGVAGNLLYAVAPNVWVVLVARLLCGAAATVQLSVNLYVIRTTSEAERSGSFARIQMLQMLGAAEACMFRFLLAPHAAFSQGCWSDRCSIWALRRCRPPTLAHCL